MEQYVDDISKMALALTSAQLAKDVAIGEYGIGEDVATHFLGWSNKYLMLIFQMKSETGRLNPEDKFLKCKELCEHMRRYWGVASITMVAEGYCSLDSQKTKQLDLSDAFLDKNNPVFECITISHVSIDEYGEVGQVAMVAAPYSVSIGKKVAWQEVLVYPESVDKYIKQTKYPKMLRNSMFELPQDDVSAPQLAKIRDEINDLGFMAQDFTTG